VLDGIDQVRNVRGHNDHLPRFCGDRLAADGQRDFTIQDLHHGIPRCGMGAEPFSLVKFE
jgi:hypothetical protein